MKLVSVYDPNPSVLQPSVRKTHCSGRKHKENVKDYYQKWMEEQAQSLIDKTSMFQSLVLQLFFLTLSVLVFTEATPSE